MTAPPAGVFDRPQGDRYAEEPGGSGKRPLVLIALAVVAALIIGGGAFAVTRVLGGGGEQPAGALPASTAAYLRMDIDPSVGQKIAAVQFFEGFDPEVIEQLESGDLREEMFDTLAEEDEAFADIDYESDIEPWLGDRLAIGVVPTGESEPIVAAALQVTDQDAAADGLERLKSAAEQSEEAGEVSVDWFFHGDYAVLTTTESLDTLRQEVEAGTLAEDETFQSDIEALGDEGVLSFWFDAAALSPYMDEARAEGADPLGSVTGTNPSAFLTGGQLDEFGQGRVAAAVRFDEDHVEMHGVARGVPVELEDTDTAQLVLDLPEDTAVAAGLEHGDQLVAAAYEQLRTQLPEEFAEMESEASAEGWTLPDDIQTLVGQSLAFSVGPDILDTGSMEDMSEVPVAYRVQTDTGAANELIDRILAEAGGGEVLVRREDDGVLTLGLDQAYVDTVASGGSLGGVSTFQSAVPNAEDADGIFYLDLNAFEDEYLPEIEDTDARASVEKVAALGISSRWVGDGNAEFTLRVVAD